jgi:hypothetical protein
MAQSTEPAQAGAEEAAVHEVVPQKDVVHKKRWVSYIWDTLDKPKEERPKEERLIFSKLDTAPLTFASLGRSQVTP